MTLAIGVLLTIAMITLLTRPLIGLTRVVERVKDSGFSEDLCGSMVPNCGRDDEIGRLSRTFRDTFERLRLEMHRVQQTDARRREMVASVSHDLRTPLTALIGQLETIRMKADVLSRDEQHELFVRASQNAQHLKRLTDALAELARLDSPDFETHPEPIAIGELVDDVVQRFAARAAAAGLELSLDYPDGLPLTRVDAALIERALSNLLDNALRVTPSGGKVQVSVVRDDSGVRVEVADTGPGVAPEDQARVFDRFYQASRHREQRGTAGLGLAIVKRVAELHGGQAGLRSRPGQGSTFFIALPQAA
jgi:signal transduction histidine kinase